MNKLCFLWQVKAFMVCLGCSVLDAGLSFGRKDLVYILLEYWVVGTDVLGSLKWLLLYVVHSII